MKTVRITPALPALGLGLVLATPLGALAQQPGVSSGSGAGTGTGMSAGSFGSTGTGTESSTGLGTTGTGSSALPGRIGPGFRPGAGADLTIPRDARPSPLPDGRAPAVPGQSAVDSNLFVDARAVADPGERALALIRIAQTAIFSKQLGDAHTALFEAAPAALAEQQPLIREQRTVAIIDTLLSLAEERMGNSVDLLQAIDDAPAPPAPAAPDSNRGSNNLGSRLDSPTSPAPVEGSDAERQRRLREAMPEWALAVNMARRLDEVTARTEALFRIVESEAYSSQRLITDRNRGASSLRPDPGALPADLRSFADELLVNAARHANLIERPIWRNSAASSIVTNAASSSQFARGFEIARSYNQPETRTGILIRLAEGQALNGRQDEAARSAALIPLADPRETLIGVLIDSLISFGRFEDARASVRMLSKPDRQLVAYSAVAESQGRRGLAESARRWISQEIRPEERPLLYRKVNDGLLTAIEQNRSRDLTSRSGLRNQP